jgi:hypothetical protein
LTTLGRIRLGLTNRFRESQLLFEVDGANAARDFLRSHGIDEAEIAKVWTPSRCTPHPASRNFCIPVARLGQSAPQTASTDVRILR